VVGYEQFVTVMTYDPHQHQELCGDIHSIFNPEPIVGSEGEEWLETPPLDRLSDEYGLDTSYWRPFEFGSTSSLMRRATTHDDELASIVRAQQVPRELFWGTFRLLGDSIIEYDGKEPRNGPFRFYPAILMSAWASFESFVRIYSELLVKVSRGVPHSVKLALLEKEEIVDKQGRLTSKRRSQPLLHRYWWLLKFGYSCEYDRGSRIWQMGQAAIDKRNELVHYKFSEMPSVRATELWQNLEAILLILIGPSSSIRRSVMPDLYEMYAVLLQLQPLIKEFEEKPLYKGRPLRLESVIFPCPFKSVDDSKFRTLLGSIAERGPGKTKA
jgi:hypothetical protein